MSFSVDRFLDRTYDERSYHCWHLTCDAWRDLTGDDLDLSLTGHHGPLLLEVDGPVNPCVVLMIRPHEVPHAGLLRNGRVLHIDRKGVRFERFDDAVRGFTEVRYYARRHADHGSARAARALGGAPGPGRPRPADGAVQRVAV